LIVRNFKQDSPLHSPVSGVEYCHSSRFENQLTDEFKDTILVLKRYILVEYFESGALLLNMHTRKITGIDACEGWVLRHLDGRHTLDHVAADFAAAFALTQEQGFDRVINICERLWKFQSLLEVRDSPKGDTMDVTRYMKNPDVNLREEDEDGALLFNPDTDRVQLLSRTGLYTWKLCVEARTVNEIVDAFKADFDEVPEDDVAADVEEFLKPMVDNGFIGILEK
jgi:glutaredoxin-related protein